MPLLHTEAILTLSRNVLCWKHHVKGWNAGTRKVLRDETKAAVSIHFPTAGWSLDHCIELGAHSSPGRSLCPRSGSDRVRSGLLAE
jgi:hypothetical protein